MTLREMFELRVGDRVFSQPNDGDLRGLSEHRPRDFGEIVNTTDTGIEVKWESCGGVRGTSYSSYDARDYLNQPVTCNINSLNFASSVRLRDQPAILACGNNVFHSGWLFSLFKQPIPSEFSGTSVSARGFVEGYDMARESDNVTMKAIGGMVDNGLIIVERKL